MNFDDNYEELTDRIYSNPPSDIYRNIHLYISELIFDLHSRIQVLENQLQEQRTNNGNKK